MALRVKEWMAYLLRTLLLLMIFSVMATTLSAMGLVDLGFSHIELAIPTFLYCLFAQAFVMFYFIGVSRLIGNIWAHLHDDDDQRALHQLFSVPPQDLGPYIKQTRKFVQESTRYKRQTIPWTMLMLILGMLAFLLGAAHDTGLVEKAIHVGPVYGFIAAGAIGLFRQWHYLGRTHRLLRKVKALYEIPDAQM